jgi:mercuric ion transport protein
MNEEIEPKTKDGRWATGGALAAAVVASSCCILPLVFGAAGISTVAVAGAFESARPYMLGVTAVLLGFGFYYNYFRKPDCAPGEACETPRRGLRRLNRSMLWFATVAVVALAFFPSYAFVFAGSQTPAAANVDSVASAQVVLDVSGMTCEACTVSVQNELAAVPGVLRSEVDFRAGRAIVLVQADSPPSTGDLLSAVSRAGYSAVVAVARGGAEG